jgi:hypothetical protein
MPVASYVLTSALIVQSLAPAVPNPLPVVLVDDFSAPNSHGVKIEAWLKTISPQSPHLRIPWTDQKPEDILFRACSEGHAKFDSKKTKKNFRKNYILVNMSWSGGDTTDLQRWAKRLDQQKCFWVMAAGNTPTKTSPVHAPFLQVASQNPWGLRSLFSASGHVAAPGQGLLLDSAGGELSRGTSFSTVLVTALLSRELPKHPRALVSGTTIQKWARSQSPFLNRKIRFPENLRDEDLGSLDHVVSWAQDNPRFILSLVESRIVFARWIRSTNPATTEVAELNQKLSDFRAISWDCSFCGRVARIATNFESKIPSFEIKTRSLRHR